MLSFEKGKYQVSIYLACLSVELYLKSAMHLVPHPHALERTHDIINIYKCLAKKFPPDEDLMPCVVRCRKYFNESRYPASDSLVYTRKFSKEFLDYTDKIKDYVEEKCFPKEDISEIFKKQE